MRLLSTNADGDFSLTSFTGNNIPSYAILSYTWGDQELTFQDMTNGSGRTKVGYGKIQFCGDQAKKDGLQYFWVDSCCIDKSNSVELSQAVNSMFRWYRNSAKCYVYLSNISGRMYDFQLQWETAFRNSRWFTRGWTIQELLAPTSVEFFSRDGRQVGNKKSLELQIQQITGIPVQALRGDPLSHFSVEQRILWTINRETTIEEDIIYSLFGIFDVYMPLIYGERVINAMRRLAEEIDKSSSANKQFEWSQTEKECLRNLHKMSLSYAAANGYKAVVRQLLEDGKADVDSIDPRGRTPLSWAAGNGHEAIVKLLLNTGKVNVDSQDAELGRTPLLWAAESGHAAVVYLLLQAGNVDRMPLSWAAENGHEAVVRQLLETGNAGVDSKDTEHGRTPLSYAVENGHENIVKLLLDTGRVEVDSKDNSGQTPLSRAAANGNEAGVKLLLEAKAALTKKNQLQRRERTILYCRHKLQKGLISRNTPINPDEMDNLSQFLETLEQHRDLEPNLIKETKINKVLRVILRLHDIPRDAEFNFRKRCKDLLEIWTRSLDACNDASRAEPESLSTNCVETPVGADEDKTDSLI